MSEDRAAYMREYRKTPAGKQSLKDQQARNRARQRAYKTLSMLHPLQFRDLMRDELLKEGIND